MSRVLEILDNDDKLSAYKEKVRNLPDEIKAKKYFSDKLFLAKATTKKIINGKSLPLDKRVITTGKEVTLARPCEGLSCTAEVLTTRGSWEGVLSPWRQPPEQLTNLQI